METESFLSTGLGQHTIYLMGASFIIGSLVTIFILLILDMLRAFGQQTVEEGLLHADLDEDELADEEEERA